MVNEGKIVSTCLSGFRLGFPRIAISLKRLQLVSKIVWTTKGLILEFLCWNVPRFVDNTSEWTKICKNCSIVFLFRRQDFSVMSSLGGFLVCSLTMPVLFRHWVFCRLMSLIDAIQPYFLCFYVLQTAFFASSDEMTFWLHLKPNIPFSRIFFRC